MDYSQVQVEHRNIEWQLNIIRMTPPHSPLHERSRMKQDSQGKSIWETRQFVDTIVVASDRNLLDLFFWKCMHYFICNTNPHEIFTYQLYPISLFWTWTCNHIKKKRNVYMWKNVWFLNSFKCSKNKCLPKLMGFPSTITFAE